MTKKIVLSSVLLASLVSSAYASSRYSSAKVEEVKPKVQTNTETTAVVKNKQAKNNSQSYTGIYFGFGSGKYTQDIKMANGTFKGSATYNKPKFLGIETLSISDNNIVFGLGLEFEWGELGKDSGLNYKALSPEVKFGFGSSGFSAYIPIGLKIGFTKPEGLVKKLGVKSSTGLGFGYGAGISYKIPNVPISLAYEYKKYHMTFLEDEGSEDEEKVEIYRNGFSIKYVF